MPIGPEVGLLVEWLGPDGAKAGLREGKLTLEELVGLARKRNLPLSAKPTREEVANELAFEGRRKIDKSVEDLLSMNKDDLVSYLRKVLPTNKELEALLAQLGIKYGSEDRKHFIRFVAEEISDTGLFQRVAQGSKNGR